MFCRYGKLGCNVEICDYFFSYRMIGVDVEFELSVDIDGWVVVGFFFDKKMVRRKLCEKLIFFFNSRCCFRV